MGTTVESLKSAGLRSSALRRPVGLQQRGTRLKVDADGSARSFYSLREKRALFGYEQLSFCKVQAGVVVHSQRPDWGIRISPRSVQLTGKVFDGIEVAQSLEFHRGQSLGYLRRLKLKNGSQGAIRLRVLEVLDPTAAHFDGPSSTWGSLGVNAFNRESHVAMDEVSDPPSARVVGAVPSPSKFYMTTSSQRATELVSAGELPDGTAGMSGQVIVISSHEVELSPGESREITFASIYDPGKLEDALSEFGRLQASEKPTSQQRPLLACSERDVTEAASWAAPAAEAGAFSSDALERYEVLPTLSRTEPTAALKVVAEAKSVVRKEGSLPHSLDQSKPGVLESALFLRGTSLHLLMAQDKKQARAYYPLVKKLGAYLLSSSKEFTVMADPSLPQGWRRHLGSGYPTGEVPEVSLAVAGALSAASQVGRMLSKSDDAARFRERAEMIADRVRKKLVDERGFLLLCRDSAGRARSDDTADMAVAAYRQKFSPSAEQAAVHRLLEKDFDTPYGPRCVPTTNQVYFNGSYGMGQLGGVWTRVALAHAVLCYRTGSSGMGSLALGKVARLATEDAIRLGGSPGEFPYWVDVEGRASRGEGSDPVAAARFLEALLEGEFGMAVGAEGATLNPAGSSGFRWLLVSDFWTGEPFSAFLGRGAGRTHLFFSGKATSKVGMKFAKSERIEPPAKGVFGVAFHSPGQVICIGNSTPSTARLTVNFAPRAADLTRHLSTPLEEYDPAKGSWNKVGSLRVSTTMTFDAVLEPNEWKAFRISSA